MSYVRARPLIRIPGARRIGMGDDDPLSTWLAMIGAGGGVAAPDGSGLDADCQKQSDARTADLDAQTNDIAKNWAADNGLYTVANMTQVRDRTMALLLAASKALDAALDGASTDLIASIRQAQDFLYAKESDSLKFTNAINDAAAKGIAKISAPDFKDWVIKAMNKASVGFGFAAYADCIKPGLLVALIQAFNAAWAALVAVIKALVKFVEDVAELVLKVPSTVSSIMDYLKYGAILVGGYYTYKFITKMK